MHQKIIQLVALSLVLVSSVAYAEHEENELECKFRYGKGNYCTATLASPFLQTANTVVNRVEGPYTVICNSEIVYDGEGLRSSSLASTPTGKWGNYTVFAKDENRDGSFPIVDFAFVSDPEDNPVKGPATLYFSDYEALVGRCRANVTPTIPESADRR